MNNDMQGVIRSRNQLAKMYNDSERRLTIALNQVKTAFEAGYDAGWDLGHAHALGCRTEYDQQTAYIEWENE